MTAAQILPLLHRIQAALSTDRRCDAVLRHSLIQLLYSSPGTIVVGVICGFSVALLVAFNAARPAFWLLAVAIGLAGVFRIVNVYSFGKGGHADRGWQPDRTLAGWERAYALGGFCYALLLGLLVFMTMTAQPERALDLPAAILAVGYCASTASRNAARPEIPNLQMMLVATPLILALLVRGGAASYGLATILLPMMAGVMGVTRQTHRQLVEALIGERENARLAVTFERLSRTDPLTGLINRSALEDRLADMIVAAQRNHRSLALLWIDVDRFKEINEALGHLTGDELLCAAARRLLASLPAGALASRFGADEFVVLVPDLDADQALSLATGLRVLLSQPFELARHHLPLSVSIGVALAPRDGTDSAMLLQHADLALNHAKARAGGVTGFEPAMKATLDRSRLIEERLRDALAAGSLDLVYQPIIELDSGRICAAEALVRWHDPVLGAISPAEFIAVAEASGLIEQLTRWVLGTACREATAWPADMRVAVNASVQLFRSGSLSDAVMSALLGSGLAAARLEIEVTESMFMERDTQLDGLLLALRGAGVRLALDDFGTGYSSLAYLSRFRFDKIKLDRGFVASAGDRREDRAVAAAMTLLARELEMETVAEGIETPAQRAFAQAVGISHGQGFGLALPQSAAELRQTLGIDPVADPAAAAAGRGEIVRLVQTASRRHRANS